MPLVADGGVVYNAAAVLAEGRVQAVYRKICLPNYAVFDEKRYFTPGDGAGLAGASTASTSASTSARTSGSPAGPPRQRPCEGGADVIVNLSMSPYHLGKGAEREAMLGRAGRDAGALRRAT